MKHCTRWLGIIWATFAASLGVAQQDSLSFYALSIKDAQQTQISTAAKINQPLQLASSVVDVYDRQLLNDYGFFSLNALLYAQSGFAFSQDYDRRTVSARGIFEGWNNNHLLLLVDGVPVNDNLYGSAYTWEITPLIFTKSVEVVRGPGSALYGSNAMNGVMNLNTYTPDDLEGNYGLIQMRGGNAATRLYDLLTAWKTNHLDATLAFNFFQTDGNTYDSYDDYLPTDPLGNPLDQPRKRQTRDARQSAYAFLKIDGKQKYEGWQIQYHHQNWQMETGHGWLFHIPDRPEDLRENRHLLILKYNTAHRQKALTQDYLLRYQRHNIRWDMRYFPDLTTAYGTHYPNGVDELLYTHAQDILARAQWTFRFFDQSAILGGVEGSILHYNGDKKHQSNIDLNDTFLPFPDNQTRDVGPWFGYILNRPVHNAAAFAQYISPYWQDKLQATVSLRYDVQFFTFNDLNTSPDTLRQKYFSQISPRLGLVYTPTADLTFKAFLGRAFRTPAPTEMFGSNTFTLASNIEQLSPETLTTFELQSLWQPNRSWKIDAVFFYNIQFQDIIAYSQANANLSTNLYDLSTLGLETQLSYTSDALSGFFNYAYNHRLRERITDQGIAQSSLLTWYPAHRANAGVRYHHRWGFASLIGNYQGMVRRRNSDIIPETEDFRPEQVAAWLNWDTKLGITPTKRLEVSLWVHNLLNQDRFLLKNNAHRFDYRLEKRRWLIGVQYAF
ncbi:MAG: TonB-dependent receptor plug domain-containing protein [Bernardetiaceae bacterium]